MSEMSAPPRTPLQQHPHPVGASSRYSAPATPMEIDPEISFTSIRTASTVAHTHPPPTAPPVTEQALADILELINTFQNQIRHHLANPLATPSRSSTSLLPHTRTIIDKHQLEQRVPGSEDPLALPLATLYNSIHQLHLMQTTAHGTSVELARWREEHKDALAHSSKDLKNLNEMLLFVWGVSQLYNREELTAEGLEEMYENMRRLPNGRFLGEDMWVAGCLAHVLIVRDAIATGKWVVQGRRMEGFEEREGFMFRGSLEETWAVWKSNRDGLQEVPLQTVLDWWLESRNEVFMSEGGRVKKGLRDAARKHFPQVAERVDREMDLENSEHSEAERGADGA